MNEGGSCRDLRKFIDSEEVAKAFGKLVSGKEGYRTILEKTKVLKCENCGKILNDEDNFCPNCGTKVKKPN